MRIYDWAKKNLASSELLSLKVRCGTDFCSKNIDTFENILSDAWWNFNEFTVASLIRDANWVKNEAISDVVIVFVIFYNDNRLDDWGMINICIILTLRTYCTYLERKLYV